MIQVAASERIIGLHVLYVAGSVKLTFPMCISPFSSLTSRNQLKNTTFILQNKFESVKQERELLTARTKGSIKRYMT